jgi:hypothetical protein
MLKSYSFTLVKSLCVAAFISNSAFSLFIKVPDSMITEKSQSSKSQGMQKQVSPASLLKCRLKGLAK